MFLPVVRSYLELAMNWLIKDTFVRSVWLAVACRDERMPRRRN